MKPVLGCFVYCFDYLCEMVADVSPADMVAQPGGIMNHPAWVIGHLTVSCQEIGGAMGVEAWLPADWGGRFGTGSQPVAEAGAYEAKPDALGRLRDAQWRIIRVVEEMDEGRFDDPFPVESYRHLFPTLRHALTQVLTAHPAYHIGQLSIWRKMMGLPRMMRGFE